MRKRRMKNIMKLGEKTKLGAVLFSALLFLLALASAAVFTACGGGKNEDKTKLNTVSDISKHIQTLAACFVFFFLQCLLFKF